VWVPPPNRPQTGMPAVPVGEPSVAQQPLSNQRSSHWLNDKLARKSAVGFGPS
jgi:hypothetical protein